MIARVILAMSASPARRAAATAPDTVSFSHAIHRGLACTACHSATGPAHGTVILRSVRDCEACHHQTTVRTLGGEPGACLHCHSSDSLPSGPRTVVVRTTTSAAEMTRALPFAHSTHASLACTECHSTPVTLAVAAACSSCHDAHHVATRTCNTCHDALAAHRGQEVHLGCAGARCHSDPAVLALAPMRNVCLSCHTDQASHKPGRDCAACHLVHWTAGATAPGAPPFLQKAARHQ
jgi:hypothetical protein